jgi:RNA polymerase sigma factor (sigma-70 family)
MFGQSLPDRIHSAASRALKTAYPLLVGHDEAAFIERVSARLAATLNTPPEAAPDAVVERASKFVFSTLLHDGLGREGSDEQGRAFAAAQAYVFPILAYKLDGNESLAAEVTDQSLVAVWQAVRLGQVREPGAFLSYLLMSAVRLAARAQAERRTEPLPGDDDPRLPDEHPAMAAGVSGPARGARPVEAQAETNQLAETLLQLIRRCLAQHPRQRRLIEAYFFEERSIPDLVERWGQTANVISVDKNRALARLRNCAALLKWAADLGPTTQLDQGTANHDGPSRP